MMRRMTRGGRQSGDHIRVANEEFSLIVTTLNNTSVVPLPFDLIEK